MNQASTNVYILNDTILIQGLNFDAQMHSHHAIKILINPNHLNEISLNGSLIEENTLILDADIKHNLKANNHQGIMLLINPESEFGNHIRLAYLNQNHTFINHFEFSASFNTLVKKSGNKKLSKTEAIDLLKETIRMFHCNDMQEYVIDNRIMKAFIEINKLEEKKISITEIASLIHLSESRFMHLFKEEVKIPFRQYLSWLRILHSVKLLNKGYSITETAMESGFTDVSHLHRTFIYFFGVNFSAYLNNSRFLQVHDYSDG